MENMLPSFGIGIFYFLVLMENIYRQTLKTKHLDSSFDLKSVHW